MVATRGRTFKRPWRRSCHSSKLKSSSAPIGRKDSWCFHAVGSSNAPLLGSTAGEGLQRIGRTSIATRWRFCGLPQSASCSENFVIPPDVFGQTLSCLLSETGRRQIEKREAIWPLVVVVRFVYERLSLDLLLVALEARIIFREDRESGMRRDLRRPVFRLFDDRELIAVDESAVWIEGV